ncbi:MAG: aminotransferase class I/II-fold pyridoxal phosphate-dependent enzyme [Clostridia bacterium]|nr:aminotransferase class I/II-fold pyridoxal phosphate-dependent enzyme [Clostridia bacterium]
MQALMLAAGMGKRLGKYTKNNTKCMLEVDGKTLIERATEALLDAGIKRFVMVVGYRGENVKKYILEECKNPRMKEMEFIFIDNDVYDKTNNIYSLYMAKEELEKDDTILLESDLIYDPVLIKRLVDSKKPNLVSVAKYEQWMDGTVIKIDENNSIIEFIEKSGFNYNEIDKYYKTVNVYKFSKEFSKKEFNPFLDAYIKAYGENEYYELVLKIIAHLSRSQLEALDVSDIDWYEIDDAQDLDIATCIFSRGKERLKNFQKRYGGYWRFEGLLDYCYLVNPYYPPKKMMDKINYFSTNLITQYPSGMATQCINAGRLFGDVEGSYLCVGNGAAELINTLGRILKGKMYVSKSVFNEYIRCFENCELNIFDMSKNDYNFDVKEIKDNISKNDIICLVNPDNPTGAYIKYDEIMSIIEECNKKDKYIIIDESFVDFAEKDIRYSLITDDILSKYKNLIVIKSISKSYGIPGLRLGVLATSNEEIMKEIKKYASIWNINSYGEYFLQIANLYKKDYITACDKIAEERARFINCLKKIKEIKVYDSEANYVLCNLNDIDSTTVAEKLIDENIFIKDLKTKDAFKGLNYIRLAVRTEEENDRLVEAMNDIIKKM